MLKWLLVLTILVSGISGARADARSDCAAWQTTPPDRLVVACSEMIGRGGDIAWAYSNRGIGYYHKGDYALAISDYNTAINFGARANRYDNRGLAYLKVRDYDRAIADFTAALQIDPRFVNSYYNRGVAYADGRADYDRAISDYTKVIEFEPRNADAYMQRGKMWERKGTTQTAVADYSQALAIDPAHIEARNGLQRLGVSR